MEYFYFHNCLYDYVWKDNRRHHAERTPTVDIMHKYGHDYKLIFVGDATMSPYEILQPGGSIEYSNDEAGAVWMRRMLDTYPKAIWLNQEAYSTFTCTERTCFRWDSQPSPSRRAVHDRYGDCYFASATRTNELAVLTLGICDMECTIRSIISIGTALTGRRAVGGNWGRIVPCALPCCV
jgi:hypothetical protein